MMRLIGEANAALGGVAKMLAFRPGWKQSFDVSADGVVRSFAAAVLAMPAFALLVASANHFIAEHPAIQAEAPDAGFTLAEAIAQYVRLWLVFPLSAYLTCRLMNLGPAFAPWLVVHNWAVLGLILVQTFFYALYAAGLADGGSLGAVLALYQLGRLYVHWRVAHGALGVGPAAAAGAAGVPIILDLITTTLIDRLI